MTPVPDGDYVLREHEYPSDFVLWLERDGGIRYALASDSSSRRRGRPAATGRGRPLPVQDLARGSEQDQDALAARRVTAPLCVKTRRGSRL